MKYFRIFTAKIIQSGIKGFNKKQNKKKTESKTIKKQMADFPFSSRFYPESASQKKLKLYIELLDDWFFLEL